METLGDNKNIIMLILIIAIIYFFSQTACAQNMMDMVKSKWTSLNNANRLIVVAVILFIAYKAWNYE